MPDAGPCWSTQQLTELLATVSEVITPSSLQRRVVEHAAEALEAEVAAVVEGGEVCASVGFPRGEVPTELLAAAARGDVEVLPVLGAGPCDVLVAPCDGIADLRLLVARSGGGYTQEERSLLRGTARVLSMALVSARTVDDRASARRCSRGCRASRARSARGRPCTRCSTRSPPALPS